MRLPSTRRRQVGLEARHITKIEGLPGRCRRLQLIEVMDHPAIRRLWSRLLLRCAGGLAV